MTAEQIEKLAEEYKNTQGTNYPMAESYVKMVESQIRSAFIEGYNAASQKGGAVWVKAVKEAVDYLDETTYEKGKPVKLNYIGADSILHKQLRELLEDEVETPAKEEVGEDLWRQVYNLCSSYIRYPYTENKNEFITLPTFLNQLKEKFSISVRNPSEDQAERCEYEKLVEEYFGLPSDITEKEKIGVDFGQLVGLVCFALQKQKEYYQELLAIASEQIPKGAVDFEEYERAMNEIGNLQKQIELMENQLRDYETGKV